MTDIGFVGAGSMGAPMVERLLAAGFAVRLYARRPDRVRRLRDLGAVIVDSAAAAGDAEVVILCPFSEDQLDVIFPAVAAGARPDTVVVQHATVSIEGTERLAASGVTFVDAPISGTAEAVLAGRLTVLLGGPAHALDRVEPILAAYASQVVRIGEAGTATKVKLVNNLTFAAHVQTAVAAVRLGEALGVSAAGVLDALHIGSGQSAALTHLRAVGAVEPFVRGAAPYLTKDVAIVEAAMAARGLDTGLLGEIARTGR
jgi:3-hydroxyisobutyrate dehydrogenase-like beta-hydroxyacid dehydrogenase